MLGHQPGPSRSTMRDRVAASEGESVVLWVSLTPAAHRHYPWLVNAFLGFPERGPGGALYDRPQADQ